MNTSKNTVLITGGSAGIGYELAARFLATGNEVIITGRDEARLRAAAARLAGKISYIAGDVSDPQQLNELVEKVRIQYPSLNILVNNAGKAFYYRTGDDTDIARKADEEMQTNYIAPIRLTEALLPLLKMQAGAAIVNVTSIVAFAPGARLATYAASKAALRSYTRTLRVRLERTAPQVQVYELMPPLVNTEFSKEIGGEKGIPPQAVADDLLRALQQEIHEVRVGDTEKIYQLSLTAPDQALQVMNPVGS